MADVLVIDTYSLFFRAFHALPPMSTSSGEPTSAIYGVTTLLLKLLREQKPSGLAFALDAPVATFRHEAYDGYKALRTRMPNQLALQLGRLDELIEATRVPSFCVPGFEADDVIATLCEKLPADGRSVLIVSSDRDLLQLAAPEVRVLFVGVRGKKPTLYDARAVEERFGVPPHRLPELSALLGDVSDNLPKVAGIGPGTARKLLQQFASLTELFANLESIRPPHVRDALRAHAEQVREVESLARLRADVPLGPPPYAAGLDEVAFQKLRALFDELEFKSLFERLEKLEPARVQP